jgi:polyisoprenoid-binding protein YceI
MFMNLRLVVLFVISATMLATGTWRADQGDVRVICPMTAGGSFDVKTKALSGSLTASASGSPSFDGSVTVDLRSLDTGIGLRNEHLRDTYLEVDKGPGYDAATISKIDLKGMNPAAPAGKGSFSGSLTLHGVTKTVEGAVDVRQAGTGLRVTGSFPLSLSDYGIRPPRYLGIGVKDTVQVQVVFAVTSGDGR